MRWRRRRPMIELATELAKDPTADEPTADEPTADEPTADEPTADGPTADATAANPGTTTTTTAVELAPRVERALVVLAAHAQQLDGRLEHIERRLEAVADAQIDIATQDDLLDLRVHSARLSAELTRVTVELRGEIEEAAHVASLAAANTGTPITARDRRVATLAEQIIDMSDAFDTGPADIERNGSTGWAATA